MDYIQPLLLIKIKKIAFEGRNSYFNNVDNIIFLNSDFWRL